MSEHAKVFWCGWRHTRTLWAFKFEKKITVQWGHQSIWAKEIPGIHWQWFQDVSGNWKLVVLVLNLLLISENKILLRMQPSAPYYSRIPSLHTYYLSTSIWESSLLLGTIWGGEVHKRAVEEARRDSELPLALSPLYFPILLSPSSLRNWRISCLNV